VILETINKLYIDILSPGCFYNSAEGKNISVQEVFCFNSKYVIAVHHE